MPRTIEIDQLLETAVARGASDLFLTAGAVPKLRLGGELRELTTRTLRAEDTQSLMKQIAPQRVQKELDEQGLVAFLFAYGEDKHFFVALSKRRDRVTLVLHRHHFPKPEVTEGLA